MNRNQTRVLFFPGSNRIVGFITTSMGQVSLEIDGLPKRPVGCYHVAFLGVDKNYQHKGYGTQLLLFAIAEARRLASEVGCRGVGLNCRDKRLAWYERKGFKCYGRRTDNRGALNMMFFDCRGP